MKWVVLVSCLGLAGCGPSRSEIASADTERCSSYGFQPGTEAFANCRMSADLQRSSINENRRRDILRTVPDQPMVVPR
jgi:hypothetical protein